jgi:PAS domain S-box-containing protein
VASNPEGLAALALVACGAAVMLYATVWGRRLIDLARDARTRRTWRVLFGLLVLFLAGYVGTIALAAAGNVDALVLLAGAVFLGGAVFVLLVVRTSRNTIERLVETTVSRDFLDDVLASMGDALLVVRDGRVEEANPAAVELFERDDGDLVGAAVDDLFAGDAFRPGEADGKPEAGGEATVVTADGETHPVLFSASSLSTDGGAGAGVICTVRDISRRKRRERELERQNDRLDEFASVVSHDLRNPLGVAQGHLELARETGDPEQFRSVARALERIESLVDDVLHLARQGRTVEDPAPVRLDGVVETAWGTVDTASATLRTRGDLGTVWADEDRLRRVLENLFRNAVEHGGATVAVTVGSLDEGAGFYVEDTGPGVPPGEREDVFENGYSTAAEGTGFGLSIVRTIVAAHDWRVSLTEGDEGGARVEIRTSETAGGGPRRDPRPVE